ncbi:MAG: hypothetical protein ACYCQI_03000 [Gammaproteobacteria bacterium]
MSHKNQSPRIGGTKGINKKPHPRNDKNYSLLSQAILVALRSKEQRIALELGLESRLVVGKPVKLDLNWANGNDLQILTSLENIGSAKQFAKYARLGGARSVSFLTVELKQIDHVLFIGGATCIK